MTETGEMTEAESDKIVEDLILAGAAKLQEIVLGSGVLQAIHAGDYSTCVAYASAFFALLTITSGPMPPEVQGMVQTVGTAIATRLQQPIEPIVLNGNVEASKTP
jgi:hypothetical protein